MGKVEMKPMGIKLSCNQDKWKNNKTCVCSPGKA